MSDKNKPLQSLFGVPVVETKFTPDVPDGTPILITRPITTEDALEILGFTETDIPGVFERLPDDESETAE